MKINFNQPFTIYNGDVAMEGEAPQQIKDLLAKMRIIIPF